MTSFEETREPIIVTVNLSREVAEYFKNYDLSKVIDLLLDMFDFTNLPACNLPRYTYKKVAITNSTYISLYNTLGPKNKMVSLGRLLEYAYNIDVLSLPRFEQFMQKQEDNTMQKAFTSALYKAYRALLDAQQFVPQQEREYIDTLTKAVYDYYNSQKE